MKLDDFIYKHKYKLVACAIVFVLIIIGAAIGNAIWNNIYSATVNVRVAPTTAKVVIDGSEYAYGEHRIKPGSYKVEAHEDGFMPKSGEITVGAGETVEVLFFLEPTEDNQDWYLENPTESTALGDIKSDYVRGLLNKLYEENPILEQLPINFDYYTSGYTKRVRYSIYAEVNSDYSGFVFKIIDYTGGNYNDALEKLKARDIDIEDYEVLYSDVSESYDWSYAGDN